MRQMSPVKSADEFTVRFRRGGEKCRIHQRQVSHSLKKLLQENAVPPWLRDRVPLIYKDDEIIAVPDIFSNLEGIQFNWSKEL